MADKREGDSIQEATENKRLKTGDGEDAKEDAAENELSGGKPVTDVNQKTPKEETSEVRVASAQQEENVNKEKEDSSKEVDTTSDKQKQESSDEEEDTTGDKQQQEDSDEDATADKKEDDSGAEDDEEEDDSGAEDEEEEEDSDDEDEWDPNQDSDEDEDPTPGDADSGDEEADGEDKDK